MYQTWTNYRILYQNFSFFSFSDTVCGDIPSDQNVNIVATSGDDCNKIYHIQTKAGSFDDGGTEKWVKCTGDNDEGGGSWNDTQLGGGKG